MSEIMRKETPIGMVYNALEIATTIKLTAGSLKQTFYTTTNDYVPNRKIIPTVLEPSIIVNDNDNIVTFGEKITELVSGKWFEDEKRILETNEDYRIDLNNHSLVIYKNSQDVNELIFIGEYLDPRKKQIIEFTEKVILTPVVSSEDVSEPRLELDKPDNWVYYPSIDPERNVPKYDTTEDYISATIIKEETKTTAVRWYDTTDGKETPIEEMIYYLNGQDTHKLFVNKRYMGDRKIKAKNLPEEYRNKLYGLNPEWDMKEVLENRNLLSILRYSQESISQGGGLRLSTLKLKENTTYTASTDAPRIDNLDQFFVRLAGDPSPTSGSIGALNKDKSRTFKTDATGLIYVYLRDYHLTGSKYINIQDFIDKKYWVQIKETDEVTPYTPAPEDLNARNYIKSSGLNKSNYILYLPSKADLEETEDGIKCTRTEIDSAIGIRKRYYNDSLELLEGRTYTVSVLVRGTVASLSYSYLMTEKNGNVHLGNPIHIGDLSTKTYTLLYWTFISKYNSRTGVLIAAHTRDSNTIGDWFELKGNVKIEEGEIPTYDRTPAPEDLAPDGIAKGIYEKEIVFLRRVPPKLRIDNTVPSIIPNTIGEIKAKALLTYNKGEIKDPDKHFFIEWMKKENKAGSAEQLIASGEECVIPVKEGDKIATVVSVLREERPMIDEKGNIITDENGNIITIKTT